MNNILFGIIIGILGYKFIYPIVDSISDLICLKIEEYKNRIVHTINDRNNGEDTEETKIIGFAPESEDKNGRKEK